MKRIYLMTILLLLMLILVSCSSKGTTTIDTAAVGTVYTSGVDDSTYVELTKINDNLWVHTTYEKFEGSRTPSNGLVVVTSEGLVLIDTPWNNEQTKELIKLTESKLDKDFVLAIITHAHDDRIGGIDILLENKIDVKSTKLTARLAKENGYKEPSPTLEDITDIKIGNINMEIFYPGEGHSSDNITVWFPKDKVLFGGCLLKSLTSTSLGSITDANTKQWPDSVERVKKRYPEIKLIIPGHGKWGGSELIDHTLELLKK